MFFKYVISLSLFHIIHFFLNEGNVLVPVPPSRLLSVEALCGNSIFRNAWMATCGWAEGGFRGIEKCYCC